MVQLAADAREVPATAPRILCIGDNTVDLYLDRGLQFPGGNAVNVAVQARRLGARASYVGCLGHDALGDLLWDSMSEEGVDLSHVRRMGSPNAWCRVRHEGNDRVFAGSFRGNRGQYGGFSGADAAFIAAHDLVHTTYASDLDAEIGFLRRHARLLSYDYSEYLRKPGHEETFGHIDIAFVSAPGIDDTACGELMRMFAGHGAKIVVATRGAEGAVALADGVTHRQDIVPADVVDTLGAGDAFTAGFLVRWVAQRDIPQALLAGVESAARACSYMGGYGHGRPIVPGQPGTQPHVQS